MSETLGTLASQQGTASGLVLDFNAVAFFTGLLSLVLGFFAIWLALRFKEQSDTVATRTIDLLVEIRTDAKALAQFAAGELQKYGEFSRAVLGKMSQVSATIDSQGPSTISGPKTS